MNLEKTSLRVPQLISAYKTLGKLYSVEFIHAGVVISDMKPTLTSSNLKEFVFSFKIDGFGHGFAELIIFEDNPVAFILKQYSFEDITYSQFYKSRHGNRELLQILDPLLAAKLLPHITTSP